MAAHGSDFLILFDVNGLLCRKTWNEESQKLEFYPVPGVKEFIDSLKSSYTLGIFSSTRHHNIVKILKEIFGAKHPFQIILDRSVTQLDPRYPEVPKHSTIKKLKRLWTNPVHNEERKWDITNTLLVDHEIEKIGCNPANCILVVSEYLEGEKIEWFDQLLTHLDSR